MVPTIFQCSGHIGEVYFITRRQEEVDPGYSNSDTHFEEVKKFTISVNYKNQRKIVNL